MLTENSNCRKQYISIQLLFFHYIFVLNTFHLFVGRVAHTV
jgi:hypothetical protein